VEGPFVEEDVLYRRTLCIGGRFVEECSVEERLVEGRFVGRMFCSEGRFMEGRFVVVPKYQPLVSDLAVKGRVLCTTVCSVHVIVCPTRLKQYTFMNKINV
jgi:hypothetical protein